MVACHKCFPFSSLPRAKKLKQKEENLIKKKKVPYFPSVKNTSAIFAKSCFKTDTNIKLLIILHTYIHFHGGLGFILYKYVLNVHLSVFTILLGFLKEILLSLKLETHTCIWVVWENLKQYFLLCSALRNCSKS